MWVFDSTYSLCCSILLSWESLRSFSLRMSVASPNPTTPPLTRVHSLIEIDRYTHLFLSFSFSFSLSFSLSLSFLLCSSHLDFLSPFSYVTSSLQIFSSRVRVPQALSRPHSKQTYDLSLTLSPSPKFFSSLPLTSFVFPFLGAIFPHSRCWRPALRAAEVDSLL